EHDFRLGDEGFGDGEALAPSPGESGGLGVEVYEAGAACQLAPSAFAFRFVDVSGSECVFKHLADGEASAKARILGDIGGAGTLADGQFAGVGLDLAGQ